MPIEATSFEEYSLRLLIERKHASNHYPTTVRNISSIRRVDFQLLANSLTPVKLAHEIMTWYSFCIAIFGLGFGIAHALPSPLQYGPDMKLSRQACASENAVCMTPSDCCDGLTCVDSPWEGQGVSTCQETPSDCTPDGERAIGAKGEKYVAYAPCCSEEEPVQEPEKGYGKWCPVRSDGGESGRKEDGHDGEARRRRRKVTEGEEGAGMGAKSEDGGEMAKRYGKAGGNMKGGDKGQGEGGNEKNGGGQVTATQGEGGEGTGTGRLDAITSPEPAPPVDWELVATYEPGRSDQLLSPV